MKIVHLAFMVSGEKETHEVEDVPAFLMARFAEWPKTARVYHQEVAQNHDVTPTMPADVERLRTLPGPFHVVVRPEGAAVPYIIVTLVSLFVSYLLRPHIPGPGRSTPGSSNNDLSDRQNSARPNGRIPDILGTVRSTPDLIAQPYKVFENNREIEYAYMAVGRGSYEVATRDDGRWDVRDDTTPVENIAAAAVKVYGPNTSPNSGSPQLAIGPTFTEPVRQVKRFTAVNGQALRAPNEAVTASVRFVSPNRIELSPDEQTDFTEHFNAGDSTTLIARINMWDTPIAAIIDFGGTYTVQSVEERVLYLTSPASVNSAWTTTYNDYGGPGPTRYVTASLTKAGDKWEGPFDLDVPEQTEVWANVVAPSGLYKIDNSGVQTAVDVTFEIEATPIDASGAETGSAQTLQATLQGASVDRKQRAVTLRLTLAAPGRSRIRLRRVTNTDLSWTGQKQDEIQWRDVYSVAPVSAPHFGDVTTVQSRMEANNSALAVKNRKLNILVTRKVQCYGVDPVDADGFSTELLPTTNAADILIHVARDPRIGNRSLDEIDVEGIIATITGVEDYFGTPDAASFNATLDKADLSFEETVATIAGAVFCQAYRRGSTLKLSFEKETEDSTLLFARNKIPGSEKRTFAPRPGDGNDGVELEYVDPADDSVQTFYLPEDRSALNAKKIETQGIRGRLHAYFHAHRALNRIKHQRIAVRFGAAAEASLLVPGWRILVADNVRPGTQDGVVTEKDGLTLTLSEPVTFAPGKTHTIWLQLEDGTTQGIACTAGSDDRHLVLAETPRAPVCADPKAWSVGAAYHLVADDDTRTRAFLVTEKDPQENQTCDVSAVNYDARYYSADRDLILGVVGEDGILTGSTSLVTDGGYGSAGELEAALDELADLTNNHLPEN